MAKSPKFAVVSPIGRIVSGDPFLPQTHDSNGQLRVYKSGPNAGQPNPQYYIGLAVPKLINGQPNQDWDSFYAFVYGVARAAWPALFDAATGACLRRDFAFKIQDGDGLSPTGVKLFEKIGHAGHWIVSFSSSFAPQVVVETSPGVYAELTNPEHVKRGYWVRIGASVSSNDSTQTPGLYMNLDKIELKGTGEVIATGQSAAETFGGAQAPAAVPEGMGSLNPAALAAAPSGLGAQAGQAPAAPAAGAPGFTPPAPGAGPSPAAGLSAPAAPGQWQGQAPQAAPAPTAAAPSPAAPVPNAPSSFVPTATTSPSSPAPAPAAPAAPPAYSGFMGTRVMLPAAQGAPYESFIQQGWTDEQLIQHGMMAAQ